MSTRDLFNAWPVWSALIAALVVTTLWFASLHPVVLAAALVAAVLAAVYHAEVIAHRVGEPAGTLVLAFSVTVIELGLIVTLMTGTEGGNPTLARDTVFAAVMLILNGIVGGCLLIGGLKYREQPFQQSGVSASLATLSVLTVVALVLPNYTVSEPGPVYSDSQLAFVAVVSLMLYIVFVSVQTVRHQDYFRPPIADTPGSETGAAAPTARAALRSFVLLIVCLVCVVLLAKSLSATVEATVLRMGAPFALIGIIIAALVLLPESLAALRAARSNRIQTSLNLALGSALATIGLTIPGVALISLIFDLPLSLGLSNKSEILLILSLFVGSLSLATGRTTVLQGAIHLVLLGVYLFTTVIP